MQNIKTEPNIGNRIVAGLVDYFIIIGFTIFTIYTIGEPNNEGGYSLNGAPALIPIIVWFLMTVFLEMNYRGTIGNLMVGLRAIPIDFCFFGIVAIITIKNTSKNQRVGDLWAKTIVVSNKTINKT